MENVIQIITQVGFPIAMCVAVWFDSRKREDQLVQIIQFRPPPQKPPGHRPDQSAVFFYKGLFCFLVALL